MPRAPAALARVARFLLPSGCVACGAWVPDAGRPWLCAGCRTRLPAAPWPRCPRCHGPRGSHRDASSPCRYCREWPDALARGRHAFVLAPPADAVVHGLKYEGWAGLAEEMGAAMVRAWRRGRRADGHGAEPMGTDLVVPVPTTPRRERRRGYNQADLLARVVARGLGVPLVRALLRTGGGATQISLPPSRRWANVKQAFSPRPGAGPEVRDRSVVLVDDVLTTGATAASAAECLASLGAASVSVLTYARALPGLRRSR